MKQSTKSARTMRYSSMGDIDGRLALLNGLSHEEAKDNPYKSQRNFLYLQKTRDVRDLFENKF